MQPWDFITLLTTEELKTAQIASNLKKKGRKRDTIAIRLSFLILNFFV